ncbi:MAG: hypothetical protein PHW13_12010 [Methylococcales bacterium]|nr:hypothetical protein [Methylococcales bacterium]
MRSGRAGNDDAGRKVCRQAEAQWRRAALQTLAAVFSPLFRQPGFAGKGRYFPELGRSFNREMAVALALNTGNQRNFRLLLAGEGWRIEQLRPLLESLSAEEWLAVQTVWDLFADFRPAIAVRQQRLYGAPPDWITLRPFAVQVKSMAGETMTLRLQGGYYPLCFAAEPDAVDIGRTYFRRWEEPPPGRKLLFSLVGLFAGLDDIIHELAWAEWLIGRGADGMAKEQRALNTGCELSVGKLRQSALAAALSFRLLLMAVQAVAGEGLGSIDPHWLAAGVRPYIADRTAAIGLVTARSALMRQKFASLSAEYDAGPLADTLPRHARMLVAVVLWRAVFERARAGGDGDADSVTQADRATLIVADRPVSPLGLPPAWRAFAPEGVVAGLLEFAVVPVLGNCLRQAIKPEMQRDWLSLNVGLLAAGIDDLAGLMLVTENYRAAAETLGAWP